MVYGLEAKDQQLVLLAMVLTLAVVGIVAVQVLSVPQQAAAANGCRNGLPHNFLGINASALRCLAH